MKTKILFLLLMIQTGSLIHAPKANAQPSSVNYQVFYDELSPYGTWINNSDYGYVWMPNVSAGFSPYSTNGYWAYTEDGWTWVSNYPWGWAPFHYGRWFTDPSYGPMWVPDYQWGPGWVSWRRSDDYYGWAPIAPGININVAYGNGYHVPNNQWTFIRNRHFGGRDMHHYYINHSNNVTIINNTTVINNIHLDNVHHVSYHGGPDRHEVEQHLGKPINAITIKESNKPVQHLSNNQLQLYRPEIQKDKFTGTKPAPVAVADLKDVKTREQRKNEAPVQTTHQPIRQAPIKPQDNNGQTIQQPPNRTEPLIKHQPINGQPIRQQQPTKQAPVLQQPNNPIIRQQPVAPRNIQPTKPPPQQPQPQRMNPQPMPQQPQLQRSEPPPQHVQPSKPQSNGVPQQTPEPHRDNAPNNREENPHPHK